MRGLLLSCLFCALLLPNVGTAQVISRPSEPPVITAANAEWQLAGGPVFFAGNFYYPAGPSIFFNGNVMVRSGEYLGVPLYTDTTLEPWSIVYVPVGSTVMRPYERLRAGELAGTTGSRTPSFPVQGPADPTVLSGSLGTLMPASPPPPERAAAIVTPAPAVSSAPTLTAGGVTIETIPAPTKNEGMWISYNGGPWYHTGKPAMYSPDRFEPVGSYRGFPVYAEKNGPSDVIYVSALQNGPLTRYSKR